MSESYDWLVIGGGFRSIIAAYALRKSGHSVALIEQGDKIGGFLSPIKWDEYWIDKGPQFFDNFELNDFDFFKEMIGENLLVDIGFSYSSYFSGKKTNGFAIPDYRNLGEDTAYSIFQELLKARINQTEDGNLNVPSFESFSDILSYEGGEQLGGILEGFSRKFLKKPSQELSYHTQHFVSFLGRKILFDQEASLLLKKSPIIDDLIAAQKVKVDNTRYNLYPKGQSLEVVRTAMEDALKRVGVNVFLNTRIEEFCKDRNVTRTNNAEFGYDKIFMGTDIRDTEMALFKTTEVLDSTHVLPEIFHCYVVPKHEVDESYYLVNYDESHKGARITNFCNYMGGNDEGVNGVICIEEPIEKDSNIWKTPDLNQLEIFEEAKVAGNVTCETFSKAKSFRIPSTYRVPRVGFEEKKEALLDRVSSEFGERIVIPDALTLTRKQAMEDLRTIGIL